MFPRTFFSALAVSSALLLAACGDSERLGPGGSVTNPGSGGESPTSTREPGKPVSAYLHDLSPRQEDVVPGDMKWVQYSIPTSDGEVIDSWVRRPPGEFGQPLVLVISPYYGGGDPTQAGAVLRPSAAIEYLISYGYAVGIMSVGGTGTSTGCFRDGGPIERKQLHEAVEYFAKQSWSNGAVASIGVSYDGTTANELFIDPPPALKTVVPIDAISDYYRYSFTMGTISRNSAFTAIYYVAVGASPAGLEGGAGPTDPANYVAQLQGEPCPEQAQIQQEGLAAELVGDKTPYWYERDGIFLVNNSPEVRRPPMLLIHGLQDNNVDPQQMDGWPEAVRAAGVPLKMILVQRTHDWPAEGLNEACPPLGGCRGDFWEQYLLAWLDQWLKDRDTGILDAPAIQVQADDNIWRHEEFWPPKTEPLHFYPQADGSLGRQAGSGSANYVDSGQSRAVMDGYSGAYAPAPVPPGGIVEWVSEPLAERLRLTGTPKLRFAATADKPRANLVATLLERKADGSERYVNFATLNLNHALSLEKGEQDITGKALSGQINLYPYDNVVAAGSQLVLTLAGDIKPLGSAGIRTKFLDTGPYLNPQVTSMQAKVDLDLAGIELELPVNSGDDVEKLSWLPPTTP